MSDADAGYPRSHRLLKGSDFQRVFKRSAARASDRFLTVLAARNDLPRPRLGTAISIRNAGNAVQRNRIKRLIRESFRYHQQKLAGWDIVVLARQGTAGQTNQRLLAALENHWRKIATHAQTHTDPD